MKPYRLVRSWTETERVATISLFREFEAAGISQGYPRSGWEEARVVTTILVEAATPKDGYTSEHAAEVARLSRLVGEELGLEGEELEWLVHGALLHDLGKLGVAEEILRKPGAALTEEEWAAVRRHSGIGAQMIEPIGPLLGAVPVVRHHHERPDGTGYPDRLEGEEIPLAACVVAVADAYDVMLRGRPYRPRVSSAEALREISRQAGRQFDGRVVEALGRVLGEERAHASF